MDVDKSLTREGTESKARRAVAIGPWEESEEYQRGQAWTLIALFTLLVGYSAGTAAWQGDWRTVMLWLGVVLCVAAGCVLWSVFALGCVRLSALTYRGISKLAARLERSSD